MNMGSSWDAAIRFAVLSTIAVLWFSTAEDELELQARLTPCELIQYFGYPCEVSYVTTEDGYILEVDRVPHGRNQTTGENDPARHPVLIVPGLGCGSDFQFLNYPTQSPGFLLVDAGFDVWAMNSRESDRYVNHTTLSKDDPEYAKWSFDEIGRYDLATCIDHVLNATGAPKLTIFTLSQGAAVTLVLLSTRPEYNDKVDLFVAYCPVANDSRMGYPLGLLLPLVPELAAMAYPQSRAGFLVYNEGQSDSMSTQCTSLTGQTCSQSDVFTVFSSPSQLNETRVPVYMGHFPLGFTIQNFFHYYQMYKAKDFIMYDYDIEEDLRRYNKTTPPPYPLEHITTSVAIFSSKGDTVADPTDVALLKSRLGSRVILHYMVPEPTFNHLDFALGYRANSFLHNVAIDLIQQYTGQRR